MTDAQWQFAGPTRPIDELYDCETDPHNTRNLARSAEHRDIVLQLVKENLRQLENTLDLGLLSEVELARIDRKQNLFELARKREFDIAALVGATFVTSYGNSTLLHKQLKSEDAGIRYWGALGIAQREALPDDLRESLVLALRNSSVAVRIAAAQSLAQHGEVEKALPTLIELLADEDLTTVLYAARSVELNGEDAKAAIPAMEKALARAEKIRPPDTPATVVTSGDHDLAMFIGFSTRAFLNKVKREQKQERREGSKGGAR